jgi:hypothetical protein
VTGKDALTLLVIAGLILSAEVIFASVRAVPGPVTKRYGDITANGIFWFDPDEPWDLTRGDLVISYTIDMSKYKPPVWSTKWTLIGVGGTASGWMTSGAPVAFQTDLNNFDPNDKFCLGAPSKPDEHSYDILRNVDGGPYVVTPPIGNPSSNYGVWFDRDGVSPSQAGMWGSMNGKTYSTGGVYQVAITYHTINPRQAVMFATVNNIQAGFYAGVPKNAQPEYYPVGKTMTGSDLTMLRVFAIVWGLEVKVYELTVTGYLYWTRVQIDVVPGSDRNNISLKTGGLLPVAVLSGAGFDPSTIFPFTVHFAGARPTHWISQDVNGDGTLDIIFFFNVKDLTELDPTRNLATLTADTSTGLHIKGSDTVNVSVS